MKAGGNIGDGKTDENGEYPDCKLEGSYFGSHWQPDDLILENGSNSFSSAGP